MAELSYKESLNLIPNPNPNPNLSPSSNGLGKDSGKTPNSVRAKVGIRVGED